MCPGRARRMAGLEEAFLGAVEGADDSRAFALARFLAERGGAGGRIPLLEVGRALFGYYWFQVSCAGLRQLADSGAEAEPAAIIRSRFPRSQYTQSHEAIMREHPDEAERCAREMAGGFLGGVAERFARACGGAMFAYDAAGGGAITVPPEAAAFLRRRGGALLQAVMLGWTGHLESTNPGAPMAYEKADGEVPHTTPLSMRKKTLDPHFAGCFYCGAAIERERDSVLDHFIPLEFSAADDLWNLVVACGRCAAVKAGSLPPRAYVARLLARNEEFQHKVPELRRSVNELGDSGEEVARAVNLLYDTAASRGFAEVRYMGGP